MKSHVDAYLVASSTARRIRLPCLLAAGLVLSACAGPGTTSAEHWTMTTPAAVLEPAVQHAPGAPVRVVILRGRDARTDLPAPVNVYIDARYQASLVGETSTEQRLCPGTYRLAARRSDVEHRHLSRHGGVPMVISTAPLQVFTLHEGDDGTFRVEASKVTAALTSRVPPRQAHTIPRITAPARCDRA